jgi:hypothetical protein
MTELVREALRSIRSALRGDQTQAHAPAAIVSLSTLVPGFIDNLKHALVAGAVAGGGTDGERRCAQPGRPVQSQKTL